MSGRQMRSSGADRQTGMKYFLNAATAMGKTGIAILVTIQELCKRRNTQIG